MDVETVSDRQQAAIQTVTQGGQIWVKSGSDCPQIGHIGNFFRSDFITFWRGDPKCTERAKNDEI